MLASRTVLFALWQVAICAVYVLIGDPAPWDASVAWWPVTATLTNLMCIPLLAWAVRLEGIRQKDLYRVGPHRVGREMLVCLGLLVIGAPLLALPNTAIATWLFGDPQVAFDMMFRPLPMWVIALSLLVFPVTIALTELPVYYAYAMPRVAVLSKRGWVAVLLAAFWHMAQHCALPLVPDARFLLWRLLMFAPFGLFAAVVLHKRPRQLPYMMVVHGLLDVTTVLMLLPAP
jgi:hypothetical protein